MSDRMLFRPILMHFAARFNGYSYGEFASDYKVLVESNMKCLEYFDMDMVGLISDPYRETSAFGAVVDFPAESVPVCKTRLVKNAGDIEKLKNPDVYKAERTLDRIKGAEYFQQLLKGEVPVIGWIEGPLAEACDLAGVSEMLMMLMMEPEPAKSLIEKCMVTAKAFAKAQIDAGCDIIGMGDAICSQIDLAVYNEFVLEHHKSLVEYIHGLGAMVKLHICGNITHLLPSLKEVKPDILDLDWQVDLQNAHEMLGPDIIRCGNINPIEIQDMTKDDLAQRVRDIISNEKKHNFILSGGCEITVKTPVENLRLMREESYY